MCGVISSKHSSKESNPDLEPNTENHGVQAWAGTTIHLSDTSKAIFANSFTSRPRMGRPSERILPIFRSFELICFATSVEGANKSACTFRTLPPLEYIQEISTVRRKRVGES